MPDPAPEPPEVEPDELAAAEKRAREVATEDVRGTGVLGWGHVRVLLAEFDRMRAELTRTVADCGICRLGGRTIYINDDCPRHGDHDGISW